MMDDEAEKAYEEFLSSQRGPPMGQWCNDPKWQRRSCCHNEALHGTVMQRSKVTELSSQRGPPLGPWCNDPKWQWQSDAFVSSFVSWCPAPQHLLPFFSSSSYAVCIPFHPWFLCWRAVFIESVCVCEREETLWLRWNGEWGTESRICMMQVMWPVWKEKWDIWKHVWCNSALLSRGGGGVVVQVRGEGILTWRCTYQILHSWIITNLFPLL